MKSLDAICAKLASTKGSKEEESADNIQTEEKGANRRKRKTNCPQSVRVSREVQHVETVARANSVSSSSTLEQLTIDDDFDDPEKLNQFAMDATSQMMKLMPDGVDTSTGDGQRQNKKSDLTSLLNAAQCANPSLEHYIARFSGDECGAVQCSKLVNREHYHCKQCEMMVFNKKEDMLRHYKWHRKREESLSHGFLRYSASDNCERLFKTCMHRLQQTHYHCLQQGCGKVYVSTSDVQMHANSHRKAAHIAREGFQRYKASENCGRKDCPFREGNHRTTHFHCLRIGCNHSFKNKADMDKHKAHHLKDEQLLRDGFKKLLKSDVCTYPKCPYSKVVNHIHCIRSGCDYVMHSTSQMYSHRRKHEKNDPSFDVASGEIPMPTLAPMPGLMQAALKIKQYMPDQNRFVDAQTNHIDRDATVRQDRVIKQLRIKQYNPQTQNFVNLDRTEKVGGVMPPLEKEDNDLQTNNMTLKANVYDADSWKKFITRYTANDVCFPLCPLIYKDHYHCTSDQDCKLTFRSKDGVREHAKQHTLLQLTLHQFKQIEKSDQCDVAPCKLNHAEKHYHCLWTNCNEVIGAESEPLFRRLEHSKVHEYAVQMQSGLAALSSAATSVQATNDSYMSDSSRRKRGRLSREHNDSSSSPSSRGGSGPPTKRGRPRTVSSPHEDAGDSDCSEEIIDQNQTTPNNSLLGFADNVLRAAVSRETFNENEMCPDNTCVFSNQHHFHCTAPRCFYSTDNRTQLESHKEDFHQSLEIPEGFVCFDKYYNCQFSDCAHSSQSRHFHCTRVNCVESFLKVNALGAHDAIHNNEQPSKLTMTSPVVKTSGIYFPTGNQNETGLPYTVDQQCGRPFCKLKRKQHYHCNSCSQGFTNVGRLLPHLQKHGVTLPPVAAAAALVGALPNSAAAMALASAAAGIPSQSNQSQYTSVITKNTSSLSSTMQTNMNPVTSTPPKAIAVDQSSAIEETTTTGYASLEQILKLAGINAKERSAEASRCLGNPPQLPPNQQKKIRFHWFQPDQMKFTAHSNGDDAPPTKKQAEGPLAADLLLQAALSPHKKFKFVDCTQDAADAVAAAERAEEMVPDGYRRYDSCSDCCFPTCSFKYKTIHLHCMRTGCGMALIDKLQVTAHNELHCLKDGARPEVVVTKGTQRNNQSQQGTPISLIDLVESNNKMDPLPASCTIPNCPDKLRGTHFHCTKCIFMSTELPKLAIHLKQHMKLDQISALGFSKVIPSAEFACPRGETCAFTSQVHYHCNKCTHIALNHLQMTVHKNTAH